MKMYENIRKWWNIKKEKQVTNVKYPNRIKLGAVMMVAAVISVIGFLIVALTAPKVEITNPRTIIYQTLEPFRTIYTSLILFSVVFVIIGVYILLKSEKEN